MKYIPSINIESGIHQEFQYIVTPNAIPSMIVEIYIPLKLPTAKTIYIITSYNQ